MHSHPSTQAITQLSPPRHHTTLHFTLDQEKNYADDEALLLPSPQRQEPSAPLAPSGLVLQPNPVDATFLPSLGLKSNSTQK
mmetsp:Transcript_1201/g.2790  ORF Transcript_1201/g.2790 Transcript_1201/m.2790 type:complete len:82 (-) Transcript_1201:1207-1452(-)